MSANSPDLLAAYVAQDDYPGLVDAPAGDRRARVRSSLRWPVLLFGSQAEAPVETITQNLSSTGFYCLSQSSFTAGDLLLCGLKIPAHDPAGKETDLHLECRVLIVRVDTHPEGHFGIACRIEDYRFLQGRPLR